MRSLKKRGNTLLTAHEQHADQIAGLKGLVRYWKSNLMQNRHLMSPSVIGHIELTIRRLEQLKKSLVESEKG